MRDDGDALRKAIEAGTATIGKLASEAGISDRLLRLVLAGDRRLTAATRHAIAEALRRRAAAAEAAAEALDPSDEPNEGR